VIKKNPEPNNGTTIRRRIFFARKKKNIFRKKKEEIIYFSYQSIYIDTHTPISKATISKANKVSI
jgi:hypothetical protein